MCDDICKCVVDDICKCVVCKCVVDNICKWQHVNDDICKL